MLLLLQIQYWRDIDEPRVIRTTDIILGDDVDLCPSLGWQPSLRRRRQAGGSPVVGVVTDLWPYSEITAGVLVTNRGNRGSLSDTITFTTKEGGIYRVFEI